MLDDVHMFVSILLKNTGSSFMGYFKGKSALMRFDKHANVKYKFGMFWIEGYGVSAGVLNEAIYKNKKSMMITGDKLSIKKYDAPLGGTGLGKMNDEKRCWLVFFVQTTS